MLVVSLIVTVIIIAINIVVKMVPGKAPVSLALKPLNPYRASLADIESTLNPKPYSETLNPIPVPVLGIEVSAACIPLGSPRLHLRLRVPR